jgi:hypothetical protein
MKMEDMRSLMRSFSLPRHLCSPKKVVFEAGIEYVNRGEFVGGCDVEGEDLVTDLTADWSNVSGLTFARERRSIDGMVDGSSVKDTHDESCSRERTSQILEVLAAHIYIEKR